MSRPSPLPALTALLAMAAAAFALALSVGSVAIDPVSVLRALFAPVDETQRVIVEAVDGSIEGTTAGLDPSGFLQIELDDGTRRLIVAGGVRPCS